MTVIIHTYNSKAGTRNGREKDGYYRDPKSVHKHKRGIENNKNYRTKFA